MSVLQLSPSQEFDQHKFLSSLPGSTGIRGLSNLVYYRLQIGDRSSQPINRSQSLTDKGEVNAAKIRG